MSSAEIETVILTAAADVLDCVALGVPDKADGTVVPLACLVLQENVELSERLIAIIKKAVHVELGEACVPAHLLQVAALPRTHNSKVMRWQRASLIQVSDSHSR